MYFAALPIFIALEVYHLITFIVVLTAAFGFLNYKFLKLPSAIGIMLISLLVSLAFIFIGWIDPHLFDSITDIIRTFDFNTVLMQIMLGFLLFAGAIHIDVRKLKKEGAVIIAFSTIGVVLSTFIVAVCTYFITKWFGIPVDFIHCLLFGALISPTDPIAVLSILRKANIPATLEMKITGESLFNDGVAVVVFVTIYEVIQSGANDVSVGQVAWLFLREAGGGLVFGLMLGYACYWALRAVNDYGIEVLITLGVVMGGYSLAGYMHISGPLAMVVAGIVTGNKSFSSETSAVTTDYTSKFWEMIDEAMNAILFSLIGLEMLVVPFTMTLFWLGCITIVVVLLARLISVSVPVSLLRSRKPFEQNAIAILTWGGLRGGLSVALALSLPISGSSQTFVSITYIVVLFSIIVQGLTIGKFAKRLVA